MISKCSTALYAAHSILTISCTTEEQHCHIISLYLSSRLGSVFLWDHRWVELLCTNIHIVCVIMYSNYAHLVESLTTSSTMVWCLYPWVTISQAPGWRYTPFCCLFHADLLMRGGLSAKKRWNVPTRKGRRGLLVSEHGCKQCRIFK